MDLQYRPPNDHINNFLQSESECKNKQMNDTIHWGIKQKSSHQKQSLNSGIPI